MKLKKLLIKHFIFLVYTGNIMELKKIQLQGRKLYLIVLSANEIADCKWFKKQTLSGNTYIFSDRKLSENSTKVKLVIIIYWIICD